MFLSISAQALDDTCKSLQLKKYVEMDYKAFDQSPPNGGWRELQDKGQDLEIAKIIDGYLKCRSGLTAEQKATLVFHSGQIYADLEKNDFAIERMKKAYNADLDKKYHWNSFVDGTIAFLQRDLKKLTVARDKVLLAEPDHPYVETLNDLIKCFKRPYKDFDRCRNKQTTKPSHSNSATH